MPDREPTIGPYRLGAKLGEGGMGEVWQATDTRLKREVAIKLLPSAVAGDALRLARFEREAQVLASLNHPGIAAIYGVEDNALVMELVPGETLAERIGGRALPPEDALALAGQIAEALAYAHDKGVVHRDLKPANIKITPEGQVKILDFGLAKAMSTESGSQSSALDAPTLTTPATLAGTVLGTAAYMAPEQARGQNVDRRADIWAFGVVLYEMLTGERPFGGPTVSDTLAAVLKETPDWQKAPSSIHRLLEACLEKDPRKRLRDLNDGMLFLQATESTAESEAETPSRWRSGAWVALVGGLGVCAILAGFAVWRWVRPAPRPVLKFSAVTNFPGVQAQPALSPDGRSVAFISNRDGAYNIYVGLVGGGNLVQITNDANLEARPMWSPDGSMLVYGRLNRFGLWDVWEVPALGGSPRRLMLDATDPTWSPDDQTLAYAKASDGSLWLAKASGEDARQVVPAPSGYFFSDPRFSPYGRELAFVQHADGPYSYLSVLDLSTMKVRTLASSTALNMSPAWSPDGRFIYFASSRGGTMNIWKIGRRGGEPQQVTSGQGDDAQLDVSRDGKAIVFSTFRENVHIARVDMTSRSQPQQPAVLTHDAARNQLAPAYSPDGKWLAYFTNLKGAENESIWVARADGSNPVQVFADHLVNVFPHWTPDGQNLVFASDMNLGSELRSIPVAGGTPSTILRMKSDSGVDYADIGADGRIVFLKDESGDEIDVFDPRTRKGQTLVSLPAGAKYFLPRWSPDQKSIAYIIRPGRDDDPQAGLWVDDLHGHRRQLFQGWVEWYVLGPHGSIDLLQGVPDLKGVVWKTGWHGQQPTRFGPPVPMTYSFWLTPGEDSQDYMGVSPDGHFVAFGLQTMLDANIGMLHIVQ